MSPFINCFLSIFSYSPHGPTDSLNTLSQYEYLIKFPTDNIHKNISNLIIFHIPKKMYVGCGMIFTWPKGHSHGQEPAKAYWGWGVNFRWPKRGDRGKRMTAGHDHALNTTELPPDYTATNEGAPLDLTDPIENLQASRSNAPLPESVGKENTDSNISECRI